MRASSAPTDPASFDDRPFSARLDELRRDGDLTFRALEALLAAVAEPGERGMTNGHLANLATGQRAVTRDVIVLVARAFDLKPESFVEWRLWDLQALFDPRCHGLEAAVAEMYAHLGTARTSDDGADDADDPVAMAFAAAR